MAFSRSILHSFVSSVADSGDATLVQPSNWNAGHSVAVAGATSGGVPYFDSATSEASSGLLAANAVVLGGGAGTAPFTSTLSYASGILNSAVALQLGAASKGIFYRVPSSGAGFTGSAANDLWIGANVDTPGGRVGIGSDNTGVAGLIVGQGATQINGVAFASLPTGIAGMFGYVTDSNTATWGATIAGGSTNKVLAFFNGANWTVAGA